MDNAYTYRICIPGEKQKQLRVEVFELKQASSLIHFTCLNNKCMEMKDNRN